MEDILFCSAMDLEKSDKQIVLHGNIKVREENNWHILICIEVMNEKEK